MKGEIEVLVAGGEEALDDILGPRLVFLLDGVERCLADAGERIGLCAGIEFIEPHGELPQIREQHKLRACHRRPVMLGDLVQIGARGLWREIG